MESFDAIQNSTRACVQALQGLSDEQRAASLQIVISVFSLQERIGMVGSGAFGRVTETRPTGSQRQAGGEARGVHTNTPLKGTKAKAKVPAAGTSAQTEAEPDFLEEVVGALGPLLLVLPHVGRQEGASQPSMDSKSVRQRLGAKRKNLVKLLKEFRRDGGEDELNRAAFHFCNAVQAFRLAARDAVSSHVKLVSNPFEDLQENLQALVVGSAEFVEKVFPKEHFLPNGFLADDRRRFGSGPPMGGPVPPEAKAKNQTGSLAMALL